MEKPFFVKQGQKLTGRVELMSNKRQSYDVLLELDNEGEKITNTLDLKNPYFRYTGQPPQPPPGHHNTAMSPSDKIWTTVDATNSGIVNGVQVNGAGDNGICTLVDMPMPQTVMGVLPGTVVRLFPALPGILNQVVNKHFNLSPNTLCKQTPRSHITPRYPYLETLLQLASLKMFCSATRT